MKRRVCDCYRSHDMVKTTSCVRPTNGPSRLTSASTAGPPFVSAEKTGQLWRQKPQRTNLHHFLSPRRSDKKLRNMAKQKQNSTSHIVTCDYGSLAHFQLKYSGNNCAVYFDRLRKKSLIHLLEKINC